MRLNLMRLNLMRLNLMRLKQQAPKLRHKQK